MTYTQMECFLEAARVGSFSQAAENLYIGQQTVSRQVQALEKELGVALFVRKNKGVELTEAGSLFYKEERALFDRHQEIIKKIRQMQETEAQTVRIGIRDFGEELRHAVTDGILEYSLSHPGLDVEQVIQPMRLMMDQLVQGRLDIIVTYSSELERRDDLQTIRISGTQQEVGFVISRRHRLAAKRKLTFQDLADETWGVVSREVAIDYRERIEDQLKRLSGGRTVQIREYPSRQSLQIALATGKCVAIIFKDILGGFEDRLRFYPLTDDTIESGLGLAWKDAAFTNRAKELARELGKH